jgi:hypothetical protein
MEKENIAENTVSKNQQIHSWSGFQVILILNSNSNIMTNNTVNQHFFGQMARTISAFCNSLFVSSTTKEFNRLKNFIAS